MKKLEFKIDIDANRKKVWDTMLNPKTYEEWVNVSWPGSHYEGNWKKGEKIKFIGDSQGGTLAEFTDLKPHEFIEANHIAVINRDGSLDKDSEVAKGWVGTTESYAFKEKNGKTGLTVTINTNPAWEKMFTDGWPAALKKLKEICER